MTCTVEARHRESRPRRGFTLVEVLATLSLVAIVLPVAMRGISMATGAAGAAKQQIEAASLAETKLGELLVTGTWRNGNLSGDFGPDWPRYRWRAEVRDWEDATLRQVDVRVEWTTRGTQRSVTLSTLAYSGGQ